MAHATNLGQNLSATVGKRGGACLPVHTCCSPSHTLTATSEPSATARHHPDAQHDLPCAAQPARRHGGGTDLLAFGHADLGEALKVPYTADASHFVADDLGASVRSHPAMRDVEPALVGQLLLPISLPCVASFFFLVKGDHVWCERDLTFFSRML